MTRNVGEAMMIDAQEMAQRLLSELEEAGEENLPTLLNTVVKPTGAPSEIAQLQSALQALIAADHVRVAFSRDPSERNMELSKEDSLTVVDILSSHLSFRQSDGYWTGGARPWPTIVTRLAGKQEGRLALELRGYQWWKQG